MNDSDLNILNKAINFAHAMNQLKSERVNFGIKLSEEQGKAINWITQSFPPHPSFTVDLAKWRNNYGKAIAAADASISCIPLLRKKALSENNSNKLAANTPLPESQSSTTNQSQSKLVSQPELPTIMLPTTLRTNNLNNCCRLFLSRNKKS
ncbi:hypothetical protein HI914_02850 [Erysiphe necator]|nr:hypothetical protein HI914_02850 [Erysiphe necator]